MLLEAATRACRWAGAHTVTSSWTDGDAVDVDADADVGGGGGDGGGAAAAAATMARLSSMCTWLYGTEVLLPGG